MLNNLYLTVFSNCRINAKILNRIFSLMIIAMIGLGYSNNILATTSLVNSDKASPIAKKEWHHGSTNCDLDEAPAIDVFKHDDNSFVLRQNKCLSYEAPFIYVLFGQNKLLILDTGATSDAKQFPLYSTVQSLIKQREDRGLPSPSETLVIHSHGHSDHYAGDSQFVDKPKTTVVAPEKNAVSKYFSFDNSASGLAYIDLGQRVLTVIQTPGHQEESISIYDSQTQWLMTGDTLYPGAIYVKHWQEYKRSIERLFQFSKQHEISAILGAHVEMSNEPGKYYPIGTTYQPDEASLALSVGDLVKLNTALTQSTKAQRISLNHLVIEPMGWLQKSISNIIRWSTQ